MAERCAAEVDRAIGVAQATPKPGVAALFDHVFSDPPSRVGAQRRQWTAAGQGV
jgi:TPP-dependent pyruvate/acetoin dehydrogenase alpha subunit